MVPCYIFTASSVEPSLLFDLCSVLLAMTRTHLSPSYKEPCDYIGSSWIIQASIPISRFLSYSHLWIRYHVRCQGLGSEWRPIQKGGLLLYRDPSNKKLKCTTLVGVRAGDAFQKPEEHGSSSQRTSKTPCRCVSSSSQHLDLSPQK